MLGRCVGVSLFALLLISMLPTVNADDTQQSSNLLTDGVSPTVMCAIQTGVHQMTEPIGGEFMPIRETSSASRSQVR